MAVIPPRLSWLSTQTGVVTILGSVSALLWALLTWISHGLPGSWSGPWSRLGNGFHYEVANNLMPTAFFVLLQWLQWALMLLTAAFLFRSAPLQKGVLRLVLGFAVLFRILLLPSVPIHENDFYRYLWDGKSFTHGINPYLYEPGAMFLWERGYRAPVEIDGKQFRGRPWDFDDAYYLEKLIPLRDENLAAFDRIGHPQVPTIYPPAAQVVFALSHLLFGDSLLGLRLVLLAFDLGILALVLTLLRRFSLPQPGILFYAWSPLILVEFTNSAHYDALPVFLLLLAIHLALRGRPTSSALATALSSLSKFFGGLVLPVLLRPIRAHLIPYLAAAGLFFAAYLPFLFWQEAGLVTVFRGLLIYSEHWQNHSGLFLLIDKSAELFLPAARESYLPAKVVVGFLYLGALAWLVFSPTTDDLHRVRKCFQAMALLFVLNPTAFPWYYTWVIPFLPLFATRSWLLLMATLQFYYLDFHSDYAVSNWEWLGIPALNWFTWLPFGLLWAWERRQDS